MSQSTPYYLGIKFDFFNSEEKDREIYNVFLAKYRAVASKANEKGVSTIWFHSPQKLDQSFLQEELRDIEIISLGHLEIV